MNTIELMDCSAEEKEERPKKKKNPNISIQCTFSSHLGKGKEGKERFETMTGLS